MALDSAGNAYVADNNTIRKITPAGVVTTLAGVAGQAGSVDGAGAAARLAPSDVAVDAGGTLYVADAGNHTVRKISAAGVVTTYAGAAGQPGTADGPAASARFRAPSKVAVDSAGNVYVLSDSAVRKIAIDGTVSTFAGVAGQPGSETGDAVQSRFTLLAGLAVDGAGNVFVSESDRQAVISFDVNRIRKFSAQGQALAFGPATGLFIPFPRDLAADAAGNLFVVSNGIVQPSPNFTNASRSVLKVTPDGTVVTVAGTNNDVRTVDGPTAQARFSDPTAIAVGVDGRIVVTESNTTAIRLMDALGSVSTLAGGNGGGSADGAAAAARFNTPKGLAFDAEGTLLVVDRINGSVRKISPAGVVSSLPGSGTATVFVAARPDYIAVGPVGVVYVSGTPRSIPAVRQVVAIGADGRASDFYQTDRDAGPIAADAAGNVYVAEANQVIVVSPIGVKRVLATGVVAQGLAVDAAGTVYFTVANTVRVIGASGAVEIRAGLAGESGTQDGVGQQARFRQPAGVSVDGNGNMYVADVFLIRKITPTGAVSTVVDLASLDGAQATNNVQPVGGLAWRAGVLYASLQNAVLQIGPLN